jgi:hypothetical protein
MYYEQSMTLVNDIYQMEATIGNKLKLMQEVLIWSLRTSESYVDDIGMEPLREDKAVREVESHHKPCHESSTDCCTDFRHWISSSEPKAKDEQLKSRNKRKNLV